MKMDKDNQTRKRTSSKYENEYLTTHMIFYDSHAENPAVRSARVFFFFYYSVFVKMNTLVTIFRCKNIVFDTMYCITIIML